MYYLHFLLLVSLFVFVHYSEGNDDDSNYSLCVDNTNGQDDTLCLNDINHCCKTLDYTLNWISSQPHSTVIVHIQHPGIYVLEDKYSINYMNGFSLIAAVGDVNITCTNNEGGLSFIHTSNIFIKGVTLYKCGAIQNSTSRDVFSQSDYLNYTVAVYMLSCTNVHIFNVTWDHSIGTSLTLYNVNGAVSIHNSSFINSGCGLSDDQHGGGGVQIEFLYHNPGSQDCALLEDYNYNSTYLISGTKFINNLAYKGFQNLYKSRNLGTDNFNFGKGGGLSIIFKGYAKHNHVKLSDCIFKGNKAHFGGGFFVGFYDNAKHNKIEINNITVDGNSNCYLLENKRKWDNDESGGGAKFELFLSSDNILGGNLINVSNSNFINNNGVSGGGIYISSIVGKLALLSYIDIRNTSFYNNSAFLGSALYFGQRFLSVTYSTKQLVAFIGNSTFESNIPLCQRGQSYAALPCAGVIYSNSFDLHLEGNLSFINNMESSIEMHSADCMVFANSVINFTNNTAINHGGGLALLDCSYLTVSQDTLFIFDNNTAKNQGGAIYSGLCNGDDQASLVTSECFVRKYLIHEHPDLWNASFYFKDNSPNDIYVTSMSPCWWPQDGSLIVTEEDINDTFCWSNWTYCNNEIGCNELLCNSQVQSGVISMVFNEMHVLQYSGQYLPFPKMFDGRNRSTSLGQTLLNYCVISSINDSSKFLHGGNSCVSIKYFDNSDLQLVGNTTTYVQVTTPDGLSSTLIVDFKPCEWPYKLGSFNTCNVLEEYFTCDSSRQDKCTINDTVSIKDKQYCITKDSYGELFVASCPLTYTDTTWSYEFSILYQNDTDMCVNSEYNNRTGSEMCAKCSEGFYIPINSIQLECLQCSMASGWAWFLLIQILPLTLMVAVVLLFNIGLTRGPLHGFVLYCQVISISYPGWFYPAWLSNADLYIYTNNLYGDDVYDTSVLSNSIQATFMTSVWNLNFMTLLPAYIEPMCLFQFTSSLPAIAFWYLIAFYPLFLLSVIVIWLHMYNRGVKFVRRITVPLHQLVARFWRMCGIVPSLTHSVCSIYLLCYMQLALTSFKLLKSSKKQSLLYENVSFTVSYYDGRLEYFNSIHGLYGSIAILVLLFVLISPVLFIVLYSFMWFHKILVCFNLKKHLWIHHLIDSFSGSFKNRDETHILGYRYFPGLYLLLRLLILGYFFLPVQDYTILLYLEAITCFVSAGVIMILRPYKINRYNFIDFLIFVYLGSLSIIPSVAGHTVKNHHKLLTILLILINIPVCVCCVYVCVKVMYMITHCYKYCKEGYRSASRRAALRHVEIEEDQESTSGSQIGTDYDTDTTDPNEFPHRVLHPENYNGVQQYEEPDNNSNYHTAQSTGSSSRRLTSRASVRPTTTTNNYGSIQ